MKIGYVGISHLSLVYGLSSASFGHEVIFFDLNQEILLSSSQGNFPFVEEGLKDKFEKVKNQIKFSSNANSLINLDLIFVSRDTQSMRPGEWNYEHIEESVEFIFKFVKKNTPVIVQSQSSPGLMDRIKTSWPLNLFYCVETLIIGSSLLSAEKPSRIIIGKSHREAKLPNLLKDYLDDFCDEVIETDFITAEFIKIAINIYLIFDVSATNLLSSISYQIRSDWQTTVKALRLDPRIGDFRYLSPGLGISGGNLERDLFAIKKLSQNFGVPSINLIDNLSEFSEYNKTWPIRVFLKSLQDDNTSKSILIIGLSYKFGTSSIINSPSVRLIEDLTSLKKNLSIDVFDESGMASNSTKIPASVTLVNDTIANKYDYIFYMYHSEINLSFLNLCLVKSQEAIIISHAIGPELYQSFPKIKLISK